MHLNLRGKIWKYQEVDKVLVGEKEYWGTCAPPYDKNKHILISSEPKGFDRMETIIHEVVHACHWDLEESAVMETSKAIAITLWRLGYRDK